MSGQAVNFELVVCGKADPYTGVIDCAESFTYTPRPHARTLPLSWSLCHYLLNGDSYVKRIILTNDQQGQHWAQTDSRTAIAGNNSSFDSQDFASTGCRGVGRVRQGEL